MPYADFCSGIRLPYDTLSRHSDTVQIYWGKFNRLQCTVDGSTLRTLDGYGLRSKLPARPALTPSIRFLSIDSHVCSRFLQSRPHDDSPCVSLAVCRQNSLRQQIQAIDGVPQTTPVL